MHFAECEHDKATEELLLRKARGAATEPGRTLPQGRYNHCGRLVPIVTAFFLTTMPL